MVTQKLENNASPDYVSLVRFLLEPLLESGDSLSVDCEKSPSKPKVLIRMAFDDPDKGRVFGRGGRNIQAIRTVLEAAAQTAGESIYLDIYGSGMSDRSSPDRSSPDRSFPDRSSHDYSSEGRSPKSPPRRTRLPKPSTRGNS